MWLAADFGVTTGLLTFDLGGAYALESVDLWNYNSNIDPNRGVQTFLLEVSVDGEAFTPLLGSTTLARAAAVNPLSSSQFMLDGEAARYVRLIILSNHGGDYVGLSEVIFSGEEIISILVPATSYLGRMITRNTRGVISGQVDRGIVLRDAQVSVTRAKDGSALLTVSTQNQQGMIENVFTWVEITGFHASEDNSDRSFRGTGLQVGADVEFAPGVITGLSFGAKSLASSVGATNLDGDMVFIQPYLAYRHGPMSGEATLLYGRGDYEQDVAGTGKTELAALTLWGGYDLEVAGATVTPKLGLIVGREDVEGTSGVLAGTNASTKFVEASIGARYSRSVVGGSYFAGLYADYLATDADTTFVSDLLVDDGWTGRIEIGGSMQLDNGLMLDTSVEVGGIGGDLREVSGAVSATFKF